jgi:hypothetical protein
LLLSSLCGQLSTGHQPCSSEMNTIFCENGQQGLPLDAADLPPLDTADNSLSDLLAPEGFN